MSKTLYSLLSGYRLRSNSSDVVNRQDESGDDERPDYRIEENWTYGSTENKESADSCKTPETHVLRQN